MIRVRNISTLRDTLKAHPNCTIILSVDSLTSSELKEVERTLGTKYISQYRAWSKNRGSKTIGFDPDNKAVYMEVCSGATKYSYNEAEDFFSVMVTPGSTNKFIDPKNLVMVGLPGTNKEEREKARADITRWLSSANQFDLTIVCEEAD